MPEQFLPSVPETSSPVADWAAYLSAAIAWESGCRVRLDRLEETPQAREQKLLARLTDSARKGFSKPALAVPLAGLQKQTLQLLQMRRQVLPEDSASWVNSQVFLAVGELHRAIHRLIEQMEQSIERHQQAQQLIAHWLDCLGLVVQGRLKQADEVLGLVRCLRHLEADERVQLQDWIIASARIIEFEQNDRPASQRRALQESLLGSLTAARLLRSSRWLMDADAFLMACLLKDTAWFLPQVAEKQLARGHHAEWSAALLAQAGLQTETVPRLIRQHHECLDGTGLPFGISAAVQRGDARLMAVVTRWAELTCDRWAATTDGSGLGLLSRAEREEVVTVLYQETRAGRWDQSSLVNLLRAAEWPLPEEFQLTGSSGQGNPHWKIPRPKYLKKQFPVLPAKPRRPQ